MLFDNTLYLAWTWYIPNPQYNVYVKSKPVNGGTWSSETLVATLNIMSSNPAPVLTTFEDNNIDYLLLVFEENDPSTGNPRIRTFYKQDGSSTWTASPHILSGSRPSVDSKSDGSKARIVYQRNGQVYTRRFNLFDKDWGIERHVSQGIYWAVAHGNPVVAFAAGSTAKAHIAWEAESEAGNDPLVYYCTIDDSENLNNYASHYQYNHSYSHPSISYDDNGGFPYIAMVKDGAVIKRKKTGSSWTTETLDNSGRAPNMALNSAGGSVWTKYNSLPYVVKAEVYEDEPMAMASSSSRMVFPLDDGAYLTLDLSGAQMNAGKLDFDPQLNASGSPQGSDDFRFDWQVQFHNAAGLAGNHARLIDIELDGAVIKTLTVDDFIGYNDGAKHSDATLFTYISSLSQKGKVTLSFPETEPHVVQLVTADEAALAKSGTQPQPFIPEAFALYPNFPNPFNPLTHIQFDLPEDAPVTLEVYNIKGQKVRTLLDGMRPAGRHEVVFNAAGLSSGIYVYRLKAGSYQAIKRMVLVK